MTAPKENVKPQSPHAVQTRWLAEHLGRPIVARLVDGKSVAGTLRAYDTYTLRVESEHGALLLFKHHVVYLRAG